MLSNNTYKGFSTAADQLITANVVKNRFIDPETGTYPIAQVPLAVLIQDAKTTGDLIEGVMFDEVGWLTISEPVTAGSPIICDITDDGKGANVTATGDIILAVALDDGDTDEDIRVIYRFPTTYVLP